MEIPLIKDVAVICGLAIVVVFVCQRIKVTNISVCVKPHVKQIETSLSGNNDFCFASI